MSKINIELPFDETLVMIQDFLKRIDPEEIDEINMSVVDERFNEESDKQYITIRINRTIEGEK